MFPIKSCENRLGGAVSKPQVGLASGAFSSLEALMNVEASWMAGLIGVPASPSPPQNPDARLGVNITPGRQAGATVPSVIQPLLGSGIQGTVSWMRVSSPYRPPEKGCANSAHPHLCFSIRLPAPAP